MAISWAAIFVRLASEAPALTLAAYRLLVGAALVVAFAGTFGTRPALPQVARRALPWFLAGGLVLGAHFWSWFTSLQWTSVGSSVVIIGLQPLLAALMARAWLAERPTRAEWWGMALATVGVGAIGLGDFTAGGRALLGDFLAFVGAVLGAAYRTIGRAAQPALDPITYSAGVYVVACGLLWLLAGGTGVRLTGFALETWVWIAMLGLVSQAIGHTALNWALGRYRVATVSLLAQAEPVLATLLAVPILGEEPGRGVLIGAPFVLAGVVLALPRSEAEREQIGTNSVPE